MIVGKLQRLKLDRYQSLYVCLIIVVQNCQSKYKNKLIYHRYTQNFTKDLLLAIFLSIKFVGEIYSVFFFIVTKVFVYLTHLKLPQISQIYLKFYLWLEHLIRIHLEHYEKYFLGIFHLFTRSGIFHNWSINAPSKKDLFTFCTK